MACIKLLFDLADHVMIMNNLLVERFTDGTTEYQFACVKSNITCDAYSKELGERWTQSINEFINTSGTCNSTISTLVNAGKMLVSASKNAEAIGNASNDAIVDSLIKYVTSDVDPKFVFSDDAIKTMKGLVNVYGDYCSCQLLDIFRFVVGKYKGKYKAKLHGMTPEQIKTALQTQYAIFKQNITTLSQMPVGEQNLFFNNAIAKLTSMSDFSIRGELERLIPSELGSMKQFFITIIETYYQKLHPIVWGQMYMNAINNLFIDTPLTPEEFFQFGSKILLLNSGPYILKILQMIRPVLSPELATKYNLTKLKYPLMLPKQVDTILKRVFPDPAMVNITMHRSASVGHVCIANMVSAPEDGFVIKIIKPLSIAQSCWEYKTLYNVFPDGCEKDFVRNMLRSNGQEMNVNREMENIRTGYNCYNSDYSSVFGISQCDAKLTTVTVRDDIIPKNPWHTFAMSLAPGMPLSDLIENKCINGKILEKDKKQTGDVVVDECLKYDTVFRSKLHRCLDLLVYKFFFSIVETGFYHGDLHAGNVFYSFEKNQMTMIDFGAVGQINLLSGDQDATDVIDIIIMSLFYNYEGIFDKLTTLLNSKCGGKPLDMNDPGYIAKRNYYAQLHITNAKYSDIEDKKTQQYNSFIFGTPRLDTESKLEKPKEYNHEGTNYDSIYSYLEFKRKAKEDVVENKDTLPVSEVLGDSETKSFADVLEDIIKYYATSGINVAIKFAEFYELQKAYALILGVLHSTGYNSYRMNIVLKQAIATMQHWKVAKHITAMAHIVKIYFEEKSKMDTLLKA
jgi:hypothetical protein